MNERFKQIWDKAAKLESNPSWEGQTKFMEKFAELIVRECDRVLSEDDGATHHSELLFTHFGVEE